MHVLPHTKAHRCLAAAAADALTCTPLAAPPMCSHIKHIAAVKLMVLLLLLLLLEGMSLPSIVAAPALLLLCSGFQCATNHTHMHTNCAASPESSEHRCLYCTTSTTPELACLKARCSHHATHSIQPTTPNCGADASDWQLTGKRKKTKEDCAVTATARANHAAPRLPRNETHPDHACYDTPLSMYNVRRVHSSC